MVKTYPTFVPNIFSFCGKLFKQTLGTAMGTRVAPTYANLFMSVIETKILRKWRGSPPRLWKHYIDDIFFIWLASVKELETFIAHMNSIHPTIIKFVAHYDIKSKTVPFLDMQISIDGDGLIQTDLYRQETDRCTYLLPSSCHWWLIGKHKFDMTIHKGHKFFMLTINFIQVLYTQTILRKKTGRQKEPKDFPTYKTVKGFQFKN